MTILRGVPDAEAGEAGAAYGQPCTWLVTIAYDGTGLVGWQRQAEGVSVQGLLEEALRPLEDGRVAVTGAGRTDAGVHALGQRASFELRRQVPADVLCRALNARLPPQVRVLAAEARARGFNARFDARRKTYRYLIDAGPVADPFDARWAWHVPRRLEVDTMQAALAEILGTHDFAAFRSAGSDVETTVRTVTGASCRLAAAGTGTAATPMLPLNPRIAIEVSGDGFLRHMVRAIVGTIVEIGQRQRPADDLGRVLASRDRRRAGATAPAQGLCLVDVSY